MAIEREKSQIHFTDSGAIYTTGNGNVIRYKKINGIYYHADTACAVVEILERARSNCTRIRIYYGDLVTGRDWLEEYGVEGCLSNSLGPLKVPLLVYGRRSLGGAALLDHCIVKIKNAAKGSGVRYQHPLYHTGTFTIREIGPSDNVGGVNLREKGYSHAVDVDSTNHANFRSGEAADRFARKMIG